MFFFLIKYFQTTKKSSNDLHLSRLAKTDARMVLSSMWAVLVESETYFQVDHFSGTMMHVSKARSKIKYISQAYTTRNKKHTEQ